MNDSQRPHKPMKQWTGPAPIALQRLLLAACLASDHVARATWFEWLAACDFDREDPASIELAGLAVGRLGTVAGDGSEASRCRGWNRRAWYLSELSLDVAQRLDEAFRARGVEAVAVGDLATRAAGYRFAGRPFPVRRVEFEVFGASKSDLHALRRVPLPDPAAQVIRAGQLPLAIHAGGTRYATTRGTAATLLIPDAGAHVAWLAARNWRRQAGGQLRWILEILAVLHDAPDPTSVGPSVVAAARRAGTTYAVAAALRAVGSMPSAAVALPVVAALEDAPLSLRSQLRRWADMITSIKTS